MSSLLKKTYDDIESLRGKRLVVTLVAVFTFFLVIGITIGYYKDSKLTTSENGSNNIGETVVDTNYEGRVQYVDPSFYPNEGISFELVDQNNNTIVLLKASDEKLSIVEGLFVKVNGKLSKTKSTGEDVLLVEEVILQNGTN